MKQFSTILFSLFLSFYAFSQSGDIAEWKMGPELTDMKSKEFIVSIGKKLGTLPM